MSVAWPLFFLAMVVLVLVLRLVAGSMDRVRIRDHVEERGGEVLEIRWSPFGRGWFGDQSNRIYRIRYRDGEDREHDAFSKTSFFGGVYLTEDRIVDDRDREGDLEAENRHLREELERLRRERGG